MKLHLLSCIFSISYEFSVCSATFLINPKETYKFQIHTTLHVNLAIHPPWRLSSWWNVIALSAEIMPFVFSFSLCLQNWLNIGGELNCVEWSKQTNKMKLFNSCLNVANCKTSYNHSPYSTISIKNERVCEVRDVAQW
jgi:hypothetical protein